MKHNNNLTKLLNLNYLKYSNRTVSCGIMDLPSLYCNITIYPDYLALYSEKSLYRKTDHTAVCFYEFDFEFDGKNGLFWAIYFNDEKRLAYFKKRFSGIKYIITPDYSELGDVHKIENYYRLFRARIVALWFMFELKVAVIPNITFPDEESCAFALNGLENCSVVAISTKGHMNDPAENERLKNNISLIVGALDLKAIIVYDVCGTDTATLDTFSYAIEKGIEVILPDNTLKLRNRTRVNQRGVN